MSDGESVAIAGMRGDRAFLHGLKMRVVRHWMNVCVVVGPAHLYGAGNAGAGEA
jgi:hypothetical protein